MSSSKTGAISGGEISTFSIYDKNTFDKYSKTRERLLYGTNIKIIKIKTFEKPFNNNYGKKAIQLQIYAHSTNLNNTIKDSLGERINFNARKSITETFKTKNLAGDLYNPAFSNNYIITTKDVKWV